MPAYNSLTPFQSRKVPKVFLQDQETILLLIDSECTSFLLFFVVCIVIHIICFKLSPIITLFLSVLRLLVFCFRFQPKSKLMPYQRNCWPVQVSQVLRLHCWLLVLLFSPLEVWPIKSTDCLNGLMLMSHRLIERSELLKKIQQTDPYVSVSLIL